MPTSRSSARSASPSQQLILIRHGESQWNLENRFTGWADVDLTTKGEQEAVKAGRLLRDMGYTFDVAYTSVLKRAIRTLWLSLQEMDRVWLPVVHSWRLNERHYGALQGLNKAETAAKYGDDQVLLWRRAYNVAPAPLDQSDERSASKDPRYQHLRTEDIPQTECLRDTVTRVIPVWQNQIAKDMQAGKRVLVVAHGNSLRALIKHLEGMGEEDVLKFNIPTGQPLLMEFDDKLKFISRRYLASAEEIAAAEQAVINQGKAKA